MIRSLWTDLTVHLQNVLRAVAAEGDQLLAADTRRRDGLPTSSAVATVVARVGRDVPPVS